ncbi:MAG: [FeFe] hydrogenase H-cluster maturation GTPase HydF, partial [Ruminococcaceae bacterium]|nr:[FeFe] hydrogenase H-cluster maturation GTPase HydF [Oscillospiraceae bacterium]
ELLPLGPVMIVDTPGFDDKGILGEKRIENTRKVLETVDAASLVCDAQRGISEQDKVLIDIFNEKKVPYIIAYSKADLAETLADIPDNAVYVSSVTGQGIAEFKEKLARLIPEKTNKIEIVNTFVKKGDVVILVTPIDESAPKGRIILPQQNVLRNLLDIGACGIVVQPMQLEDTLKNLKEPPAAVITDSQVFGEIAQIVPKDVPLTSFSILFANYKGVLSNCVKAVSKLEQIKDGDRILIAEGCTHHRQCNDIGSVKIPAWLKKHTGKEVVFEFNSGREFAQDLSKYAMVIHCGGCMLTEKDVTSRMEKSCAQDVPFVNYGILIAYMKGILKRSLEVFPELYESLS